jgi:hypothetical protein
VREGGSEASDPAVIAGVDRRGTFDDGRCDRVVAGGVSASVDSGGRVGVLVEDGGLGPQGGVPRPPQPAVPGSEIDLVVDVGRQSPQLPCVIVAVEREQGSSTAVVEARENAVGVATFLGSPAMNLHDVDLTADGTASRVRGQGLRGRLPAPPPGARVRLGWHPADALIDRSSPSRDGVAIEGVVDVVEFTGEGHLLNCTGPDGAWTASLPGREQPPAAGSQVLAFLRPERVHLFDVATGVRVAHGCDEPF